MEFNVIPAGCGTLSKDLAMMARYKIPACAGMTVKGAGMTVKGAGITVKGAGMTIVRE